MEYFKRWNWENVWRLKKIEKPNKILDIVEEILGFNKKLNQDMD